MKTLVIVAHPDDEVLGCGGTIARMVSQGHDVRIAILGEGIASRYQNRHKVPRRLLEELQECSRSAVKILGAKEVFFLNLPDNRFDTVPLLDVVKHIEKLVSDIEPEVIYTHHGGDLNVDHVVVNRAVLTATRPVADQHVKTIYAFEIPSSTEWSFNHFNPQFHPNAFVDISNTVDKKIEAMRLYDSERRTFPHPRSIEALKANALKWGSTVGLGAAEAFQLIRTVV